MVPFPDVVATAIRVVLKPDQGKKILRLQLGIQGCDLFVEVHGHGLSKQPERNVYPPAAKYGDVALT